jgi:hypothetical protein
MFLVSAPDLRTYKQAKNKTGKLKMNTTYDTQILNCA